MHRARGSRAGLGSPGNAAFAGGAYQKTNDAICALYLQYGTPMRWYLPPTKHPFPDSRQGMFVFSQKVPPILGVHFQSAGGCGGAAARPPAYVLSIPGLFVLAVLVSPCLPVRVLRLLKQPQPRFLTGTSNLFLKTEEHTEPQPTTPTPRWRQPVAACASGGF